MHEHLLAARRDQRCQRRRRRHDRLRHRRRRRPDDHARRQPRSRTSPPRSRSTGRASPASLASPFGIAIDGAQQTGLVLAVGSGGSTIRGLALGNFSGPLATSPAIEVDSDGNTIAGNSIGVAADGVTSAPNRNGIVVTGDSNTIGGGRPRPTAMWSSTAAPGAAGERHRHLRATTTTSRRRRTPFSATTSESSGRDDGRRKRGLRHQGRRGDGHDDRRSCSRPTGTCWREVATMPSSSEISARTRMALERPSSTT